MNELLIPALTSFIAAFITWMFARRKNKAEAQGAELTNVEQVIRIYRKALEEISEELNKRISNQNDIIIKQQNEINCLKSEIKILKTKINQNENYRQGE